MSEKNPRLPQVNRKKTVPSEDKRSNPFRAYALWTGLAFQMAAFVLAGLFLAKFINKSLLPNVPWMPVAGALAGVIAALVFAIRFILKHQNDH